MAAPFVPFDCLSLDVGNGLHVFSTDVLKVYLSNVAPNVGANTQYGAPADLATAGGYTAGGVSLGANTWNQVGGLASLIAGANVVFTATTGFGPFRYAILYNFTSATKPLIGYYDNGSSISVSAGNTFAVDFGASVFTLQF